MKQSTAILSALSGLLAFASADFDIYAAAVGGTGIGGNSDTGVQIYAPSDGVIDCKDAHDWIWGPLGDVSGDRYGVRCKGDGCSQSGDPTTIDELELNTRTGPHFTYYKNPSY